MPESGQSPCHLTDAKLCSFSLAPKVRKNRFECRKTASIPKFSHLNAARHIRRSIEQPIPSRWQVVSSTQEPTVQARRIQIPNLAAVSFQVQSCFQLRQNLSKSEELAQMNYAIHRSPQISDSTQKRFPLTAAISRDQGKTREHWKNLEEDRAYDDYGYTSVVFVGH
jgi:hypothetical protein